MSKYRIQTVSQLTGLTSALIRAWEQRYQLVVPERTAAGYRLYSDEDVAVLRGAQLLIRDGMAPMQMARLPREQLLGRAGWTISKENAPEAPDEGPERRQQDQAQKWGTAPGQARDQGQVEALFSERVEQLLDAFMMFDCNRVEALLAQPLAVLPPLFACEHLLLPLLQEIGTRWHEGHLSVAAEHFGTCIVRGKLLCLLDTMHQKVGSRRVVCACPPGELHELGLLMFALSAAAQGWEPIYLGADLPIADLRDAVERTQPDLVGLSIPRQVEGGALRSLLLEIKAALGPAVPLLIGGQGVAQMNQIVVESGCVLMPGTGCLEDLLTDP